MLNEAVWTLDESLVRAVTQGLLDTPKTLPPKLQPLRSDIESTIMQASAAEIARGLPDGYRWVDLGASASCEWLLRVVGKGTFMPVAKEAHLFSAPPEVAVRPLEVDFERPFVLPPSEARTMVSLLGAMIGSFEPLDATRMLRRLCRLAGPNGNVLIGIDRKKDPAVLQSAANDHSAHHLSQLQLLDIATEHFKPHAFYDPVKGCVEMHLVSMIEQRFRVGDHKIAFNEGESIRTERAYKYTPEQFRTLARSAGLVHQQTFCDPQEHYALMLFAANSD